MTTWPAIFKTSGVDRLDGDLILGQSVIIDAGTINGVAVNNTPSSAGECLATVDTSNSVWTTLCTVAAGAPPGTYGTPLYADSTALTGGLYFWDGGSYVQIGGAF